MTFEHKIVVGLEDIRAVIFECKNQKCKTRTAVPADVLREVPLVCPLCNSRWHTEDLPSHVTTSAGAPTALVQAIVTMRVLQREGKEAFRILLEFDEPGGK